MLCVLRQACLRSVRLTYFVYAARHQDLSGTLREDVKWVNLHEILETIPFIAGNEKRFVAQLSTKLKSQVTGRGRTHLYSPNIHARARTCTRLIYTHAHAPVLA